jgi:hypothetical protein
MSCGDGFWDSTRVYSPQPSVPVDLMETVKGLAARFKPGTT